MNILHLKYVVEVARTKSLSRAAENLFVSQPNLSRSVKEFEEALGITIFERTSKGVTVTPEGRDFLEKGEQILRQIQVLEQEYSKQKTKGLGFSIAVPRATYISTAFTQFVRELQHQTPMELHYYETNASQTIDGVTESHFPLGIIRLPQVFAKQFHWTLEEKELEQQVLLGFRYKILVSKDSPLASRDAIALKELENFMEINHGDHYVPSVGVTQAQKQEFVPCVEKRVFVYERASQFQLLRGLPQAYMLVSPMPEEILSLYQFKEISILDSWGEYEDWLIYRKGYTFSTLDQLFLQKVQDEIERLGF